ncbi:hypothetical protein KXD98_02780 [Mycobacterium sp. SMC-4]|nr:hypothetical protein [Mycobacterium sp. SMC-4]UXA18651.1 hypothetical protein KXD98_02780 [Mycobacterium sp. SMC-4]
MTRPDDSSSTRPISVAELLAKNGTIGAPPVGGRRRRRRGNADAVTVAELTGEIPVIRDVDTAPPPPRVEKSAEPVAEAPAPEQPEVVEPAEQDAATEETGVTDVSEATDVPDVTEESSEAAESSQTEVDYADAVAEFAARAEQADTEPATTDDDESAVDAEGMSPDPVVDGDEAEVASLVLTDVPELEDLDTEAAFDDGDSAASDIDLDLDLDADADAEDDTDDELPSYLRSTSEPLFGGSSLADGLTRADRAELENTDLDEDFDEPEHAEPRRMSSFVHGTWIVAQSVLAVVFGAGLFIAFDQLWTWNNIVALVLSVLVILGLVVAVRVVRKTEDIGSTLIAVAVGALVTLGPLALLQSG